MIAEPRRRVNKFFRYMICTVSTAFSVIWRCLTTETNFVLDAKY